VSLRHARLLNFVDGLLRIYIESKGLGELFREVVAVRLSARNVFLPDLAFFTAEQVPRLGATYASEAPALVVEALSDWSADGDVGPKFAEYEHAGVQEYWVLDPETLAHRFYRREGELFMEFASQGEIIRSEVVRGFWMERAWLDPDHLPRIAAALDRVAPGRA
jgi:Uma2 family endonuclease